MFSAHEVPLGVRRRLYASAAVAVLGLVSLLAWLWTLQVLRGEELAALSENNRIRLRRIPATRGRVVDRFNRVLVDSQASFDALLVPEDTPDLENTVETLAHFLNQSASETRGVLDRVTGRPPFQEILVKRDLEWEEVVAIETHQLELPGVSLRITPRRNYLHGSLLAHVLGYVGEVSQADLNRDRRYRSGDLVGKSGLEKVWDQSLRGVSGGQQIEVDALGRELRVLEEATAIPGNTLALSIDLDLQQAAEAALGEQAGSVVALDPDTGDLLAMVSHPTFDPNRFTHGIDDKEWRALIDHPRRPLTDRTTQGQYPPGSTFKFIVAAAALEEGIINPFTRLHCAGKLHFGQRDFRCWKKGGHGSVNVHDALVQSCDVFFYHVGQRLGVDTIADVRTPVRSWASNGDRTRAREVGDRPGFGLEETSLRGTLVFWGDTVNCHRPGVCDGDPVTDGTSGRYPGHRYAVSTATRATYRRDLTDLAYASSNRTKLHGFH